MLTYIPGSRSYFFFREQRRNKALFFLLLGFELTLSLSIYASSCRKPTWRYLAQPVEIYETRSTRSDTLTRDECQGTELTGDAMSAIHKFFFKPTFSFVLIRRVDVYNYLAYFLYCEQREHCCFPFWQCLLSLHGPVPKSPFHPM